MAKVAVIGCGHWGKNLVRNFAELGALVAISDSNSKLAAQFSTQFNLPALDFETILELFWIFFWTFWESVLLRCWCFLVMFFPLSLERA